LTVDNEAAATATAAPDDVNDRDIDTAVNDDDGDDDDDNAAAAAAADDDDDDDDDDVDDDDDKLKPWIKTEG
jgi:hypothetical protein